MGMFDSLYAELACPNCGCQAVVEAQTKDFENALLVFTVGQAVASLTQAELHGLAGCRWCDATIEVPVYVREGRFVGFGEATLRAPQRIPLPPPPLKIRCGPGRSPIWCAPCKRSTVARSTSAGTAGAIALPSGTRGSGCVPP
jgi:hypothetical protein